MALLARSSLFQTLHGDLGFVRTLLVLLRRVGFELRRLRVLLLATRQCGETTLMW